MDTQLYNINTKTKINVQSVIQFDIYKQTYFFHSYLNTLYIQTYQTHVEIYVKLYTVYTG